MENSTMISPAQSTLGFVLSFTAAVTTNVLNWFDVETINSGFIFATTLVAFCFALLKLKGQRLQNRSTQLDNESKKLDNDAKRKDIANDELDPTT